MERSWRTGHPRFWCSPMEGDVFANRGFLRGRIARRGWGRWRLRSRSIVTVCRPTAEGIRGKPAEFVRAVFDHAESSLRGPPGLGGQARRSTISSGGAAGESRHISRGRLRRDGAESGLDRSNRELPVPRLLSPCYLPVPSLLSANNLPVILPLRARRRAAPYFDNRLKRNIFLVAD
jgi:hypothetical protein